MKVSELDGALLDYWVARAEGVNQARIEPHGTCTYVDTAFGINIRAQYSPSTQWEQGGPIIGRAKIDISAPPNMDAPDEHIDWAASVYDPAVKYTKQYFGDTPLLAAMRAYIVSKFGEEIEDTAHNL